MEQVSVLLPTGRSHVRRSRLNYCQSEIGAIKCIIFGSNKTILTACLLGLSTPAHSDTLIRCPDWKQLVAVNEGRAVLRKAAPDADFDALIKAAASAKAASNSASTPAPNRKAKQTPIPVPPTTCTHTVVVGDTLSKIAKSRLGDPKRWVELQKLNAVALKGKTVLRIGQILSLPCVSGAAAHNTNQPIKPAPAPVPVWSARGGETLTTVLTRWSKGAGVKLIIDTRDDWIISVPVQIKGSFKSAVDELIEGLSTTGATPPVRIFSNNILKLG